MANEQNLKRFGIEKEAREAGKKGGVASGIARRKKRTMKNAAKFLLDMGVAEEKMKDTMRAFGLEDEDLTNQMAVMISVFRSALTGDVRAAEFLRDTAGQGTDYEISKKEVSLRKQELEYKKEKDMGVALEIEDMDEIEGEIYGNGKSGKKGKQEQPSKGEND